MGFRAYKYRAYPTEDQKKTLDQWFAASRMVYNAALEQRKTYGRKQGTDAFGRNSSFNAYRQRKEINYNDIKAKDGIPFRPGFKNDEELSWITSLPSSCNDYTLAELDKAFDKFYSGGGYPKYRSVEDRQTLTFPVFAVVNKKLNPKGYRVNVVFGKYYVKLPKIGKIKYNRHKKFYGEPKISHISKEGDMYFIVLVTEHKFKEYSDHEEESIGVDLGVTKPVMLSNGDYVDKDNGLTDLRESLKKAQRKLSRAKKGSNRRKKAVKKVAELHRKIAARRAARNHAATTEIARKYKKISIENLSVSNMTKSAKGDSETHGKNVKAKSGLNREILNTAPYQFRLMLTYKAEKYGNIINVVDPKYTSQTCFVCGNINKENRKKQAEFKCTKCGHKDNADKNAALNILKKGFPSEAVVGLRKTPSEYSNVEKHAVSATSKGKVSCFQPAHNQQIDSSDKGLG